MGRNLDAAGPAKRDAQHAYGGDDGGAEPRRRTSHAPAGGGEQRCDARADSGSPAANGDLLRRTCGEYCISYRGRSILRAEIAIQNASRAGFKYRLTAEVGKERPFDRDRKSTRLNSSHSQISYAVFCLKKKKLRFIRRRN